MHQISKSNATIDVMGQVVYVVMIVKVAGDLLEHSKQVATSDPMIVDSKSYIVGDV